MEWETVHVYNLVNCLLHPRPVVRVHKFKDYAFVHLENRADAEIALSLLRSKYKILKIHCLYAQF